MSELQLIPMAVATSASALLGRSVLGADGKVCGKVKDLAVDVSTDQTHVAALILQPAGEGRGGKAKKTLLPVAECGAACCRMRRSCGRRRSQWRIRSNTIICCWIMTCWISRLST